MLTSLFQKTTPSLLSSYKKQGYTTADLHFHTKYSLDAISKPENVLKLAQKKKIGFAVTDHNQIDGAVKAVKLQKQKKQAVFVIPGIEATCKEGSHLIYYFYSEKELQEWYKKELLPHMQHNPFFAAIRTTTLIENSKNYNALLCTPHPFAPGITGFSKVRHTQKILKHINVIEGINAFNIHSLNLKALAWAKMLKRGTTGGSDGHTTPELGTAVTFAEGSTKEEFLGSMKKGKSFAVGNEESIFHKALISLLKEEVYIKKAKEQKEAFELIESQYSTEASYLKKKHDQTEGALLHYFKMHHF